MARDRSDSASTDSGPFAIVPVALLNDPDIDDRALRLYVALSSYADRGGQAWPSQEALAERLGVSVPTVKRGLRTLVETDWVTTTKRRNDGGHVIGNAYIVRRVNPGSQGIKSDPQGPTPGGSDSDGLGIKTGQPKDHTGDPSSEQTNENRPGTDQTTRDLTLVSATPTDEVQDPIRFVFDAWRASTNRTQATKLDGARRRLIRLALNDYPMSDVLDAVRGWEFSAHHRGENGRNTVYNDLALLLRDASHLEMFRDYTRGANQGSGVNNETWSNILKMREMGYGSTGS